MQSQPSISVDGQVAIVFSEGAEVKTENISGINYLVKLISLEVIIIPF